MMKEANLSAAKSEIPFTPIATDYRIEQKNRVLSILGGIKGIANSSQNLYKCFLLADKMGKIIAKLCNRFGISEEEVCKREDHYHLSGSKIQTFEIIFVK